jgi:hypothetical protein
MIIASWYYRFIGFLFGDFKLHTLLDFKMMLIGKPILGLLRLAIGDASLFLASSCLIVYTGLLHSIFPSD